MKLVVTGADRPLGALLCRGLAQGREVAPAGAEVDLRSPEQVAALLQGAQALVHALPFDPPMGRGPEAEGEVLDLVARSTYTLVQAAINLTVVRPHPALAFTVSMVGAFNLAKAAAECGLKRLIHTGPYHTRMGHEADYWNDFQVAPEAPLHPGDDLYALTKYLGLHITDRFARAGGLEVLTYLFCNFQPRQLAPEDRGRGIHPFATSWEDTGEAFLCGLRAPKMPSPHEVFFICAELPHGKFRADKAQRLLKWRAKDTFEEWYRKQG